MHVIVLLIWMASFILLAIEALVPPGVKIGWLGLCLFDLWLGLQYLLEVSDPITF